MRAIIPLMGALILVSLALSALTSCGGTRPPDPIDIAIEALCAKELTSDQP